MSANQVAPASVCSSYLKRKLSQGNGDGGCQVVSSKAIGGHAQNVPMCNKLLCVKGRDQSLKDIEEIENGLTEDHIILECVLGTSLPLRCIPASLQSKGGPLEMAGIGL